jgi:8-oxo-dGTP pyrophosphatase MutT (NUDIX family)
MAPDPLTRALLAPPLQIDPSGARRAGVALVVDPDDTVLFIRRADKAGDPWSGHVGLPGGHAHESESFLDAAVRETLEEVGVDLGRAAVLGTLDDVLTPSSLPAKVVRPWVFRAPELGPFTLQADEVASVHPFPLEALLAGDGRSSFELDYRGTAWTLPCVDLDGVRLWGLTLRIVDQLLDRLDGRGQGLDRL